MKDMLPLVLLLMVAAPAKGSAQDGPAPIRKIALSDDSRLITLRVAANAVTSVRFNRSIDKDRIICGDNQSFIVAPQGDNQLNIKGGTDDLRASTNCNLQTTAGTPVLLRLVITDKSKADAFIEAEFTGNDSANLSEAEFAKRYQRVIDDKVFAAVEECERKAAQGLVSLAADGIVFRRVSERAVVGDVILVVREFVKLGSRGVLRFSIDNQSRDAWPAGSVKLMFSASGQEPLSLDVKTFFKAPVADRGEEIFGAIVFDMYQLPESARFSLQALEKNGSRHPQVTNIRL